MVTLRTHLVPHEQHVPLALAEGQHLRQVRAQRVERGAELLHGRVGAEA